jgi:para-nitrobenzyl esterase
MKVAAGVNNDAPLPDGAEPLRLRWGPVVDGKVIPDDPNASPISKDIPAIQGGTRTERTVYVIDSGGYGEMSESELEKEVAELVGDDHVDHALAIYRKEKSNAKPFALSFYINTDTRAPGSLALARNGRNQAPTWVYRWDWETPVMDLLAPHTMEIPFVMSHIDDCTAMTGPVNEAMHELEAQASGAWVALATNGDPNHKGLPNWPAFTDENRAVMCFDAPCHVENDPGAALRKMLLPGAGNRGGFGL